MRKSFCHRLVSIVWPCNLYVASPVWCSIELLLSNDRRKNLLCDFTAKGKRRRGFLRLNSPYHKKDHDEENTYERRIKPLPMADETGHHHATTKASPHRDGRDKNSPTEPSPHRDDHDENSR